MARATWSGTLVLAGFAALSPMTVMSALLVVAGGWIVARANESQPDLRQN